MVSSKTEGEGQSVEDILRSSLIELSKERKGIYDALLNEAREGFFEQHQTKGALKKLAGQLLKIAGIPES